MATANGYRSVTSKCLDKPGPMRDITVRLLTTFGIVEAHDMRQTAHLRLVQMEAPATETRTVGPQKRGDRAYLTEVEVEALMGAARKRGRYGHRDSTMILLAYRHGLRVSELVALRWDQVDLDAGRMQVK